MPAKLVAELHGHQRIKSEVHEASVTIRRLIGIAPQDPHHMLADEVAEPIMTFTWKRLEEAYPPFVPCAFARCEDRRWRHEK